jgi:hypothetical protein
MYTLSRTESQINWGGVGAEQDSSEEESPSPQPLLGKASMEKEEGRQQVD